MMPISKRYNCIHTIGRKTNNRCHLCFGKLDPNDYGSPAGPLGAKAVTVDHYIPQSLGGGDDPENLFLAHAGCNSRRGNKPAVAARHQLSGRTRPPLSTAEVRGWSVAAGAAGGGVGALVGMKIGEGIAGSDTESKAPRNGAIIGGMVGATLSGLLCFNYLR